MRKKSSEIRPKAEVSKCGGGGGGSSLEIDWVPESQTDCTRSENQRRLIEINNARTCVYSKKSANKKQTAEPN